MDYIEYFKNLKPLRKYARKSPEKAVLLLAVMDLYESGKIENNRILYDEVLALAFQQQWNKLLPNETMLFPNFGMAFWSMHTEPFWHIIPISGKEETVENLLSLNSTPSDRTVKDVLRYVELDEDLYFLMTLSSSRRSLKETLLENYFDFSAKRVATLIQEEEKFETELNFNSLMDSFVSKSKKERRVIDKTTQETSIDIDEDSWLTLCICYYTFMKKNIQIRDIFRETFDSPYKVYNFLLNKEISVIPSIITNDVITFLNDLQISLMKDNTSLQLIDIVQDKIKDLNGEDIIYCESVSKDNQKEISNLDEFIKDSNDLVVEKEDGDIDYNIEEDNNAVEEESQKTVEDFYIENYYSRCAIFNNETKKIYSAIGKLKIFEGKPYLFNFLRTKFNIKEVVRNDSYIFTTGALIFNISSKTDLFKVLKGSFNYLDAIWNILYDKKTENCFINVEGTWYNSAGDIAMGNDLKTSIQRVQINGVEDTEVNEALQEKEELFNYIPKGKLKKIENHVNCSYDYLWTMAIIDLVYRTNRNSCFSFDNIACMMLANAWILLRNSPGLVSHETNINECINFLINESKEGMEKPLSWDSSKEEVFEAIKNFPMYGVFEDTIDELLETSPINILKTWYSDLSEKDILIESKNFTRPCLYALNLRKIDPFIIVNKNWLNNLYYEHDNLLKYFSIRYSEYINKNV